MVDNMKYKIFEQAPFSLKMLAELSKDAYEDYEEGFFGRLETLDERYCVEAKIFKNCDEELVVFLDFMYLVDNEKDYYYEMEPGEDDWLKHGFTYDELITKMQQILDNSIPKYETT